MTYSEFQNRLLLADRMITGSSPRKVEYGRGYQSGIQSHFSNPQLTSPPDHYTTQKWSGLFGQFPAVYK